MPVLARFGQFRQFRRFTRNSPRSPPEGSRGLVESWSKGRLGPWSSGPYFPVSAGGVRPVIRAANSSSGEMSVAASPMVWSSIHRQLSIRMRGRKLASPGGQLCLRHQEIARAEDAGRAIRSEGPRCVAGCIRIRWAGTPSMVCWPRCGASCSGTPSSPSSTAPTTAGAACRPACWRTALLLQSHDKVSDAEAKARADFDLRWKVALGIEVEDRPFAKSTLQVFRAQLILHHKVREVFDSSLRLARESGYLKRRGMKVALDTTNILSRGAVKDTFNPLADGMVKLARALAAVEKITGSQIQFLMMLGCSTWRGRRHSASGGTSATTPRTAPRASGKGPAARSWRWRSETPVW